MKQRICCNPFRRHKKNITSGLTVVTLEEAKYMKLEGRHIDPGTKLCKTCKMHINEKIKIRILLKSMTTWIKIIVLMIVIEVLKKVLFVTGSLPSKKHATSINHRRSETKKKLIKAQDNLKQVVLLFLKDRNPLDKDTRKKAENFNKMVLAIKQKIAESDKRTIVQLLTLAP